MFVRSVLFSFNSASH